MEVAYVVTLLTAHLHHIQSLSGLRLNMDSFRDLGGKEEQGKLALMLCECVRSMGQGAGATKSSRPSAPRCRRWRARLRLEQHPHVQNADALYLRTALLRHSGQATLGAEDGDILRGGGAQAPG